MRWILILSCWAISIELVSAGSGWMAEVNGHTVLPGERSLSYAIAEQLLEQRAHEAGSIVALGAGVTSEQRRRAIEHYLRRELRVDMPNDTQVRAKYDEVVATLGAREFRISLIYAQDQSTIAKARHALDHGEDFPQVAQQFSQAPSAARGGELGWVSFALPVTAGNTNGLPLSVARSVTSLRPGEVSTPLPHDDGWVLIRVDDIRPTLVPLFSQVRESLRAAMYRRALHQAIRDIVVQIVANAEIVVDRR